jgi:uncharacterized membrane protein YjjP (DUF1212 family)
MRRLQTEMLAHAGRLLLEYDESTGAIHHALESTAKALTGAVCNVAVSYGGVVVSLAGDSPVLMTVRELRYNTALQARVHSILKQVRSGELDPATALDQLRRVEADTPRHSRWLAVLLLGVAAAGLGILLGADGGAVMVAGLATGLGLVARQELGRRHFNFLLLPLTAAFIGAVLGGLAIRLHWTQTPGLALIVPSLMVVPGPHLINGLMDLIDNYLPMSIARFGLAAGILFASTLGVIIGIELIFEGPLTAEQEAQPLQLNVFSDMVLAGIVTCGFAVFYNTAWVQVGLAAVGGMAGHGLRFVALETGLSLEAASLLGGLAVGAVSAWIVRSNKTPVAVIGFAGAVTMIPGLQMYRAQGGALQLARLANTADMPTIAATVGSALNVCLVVSALALGLIVGARAVLALAGERESPASSSTGSICAAAISPDSGRTYFHPDNPSGQPECMPRYTDNG